MESKSYEHLGITAFWIFMLQMMSPALIFLLIAFLFPQLSANMPQELLRYTEPFGRFFFLIGLSTLLIGGVIGYLRYVTYKFCLADDALLIEQGILNKERVSIPYRQVQNINLNRSIIDRLLGVSHLIILTAGHDDDDPGDRNYESEGHLPLLNKHRAEQIQAELLKHTNTQRVIAG